MLVAFPEIAYDARSSLNGTAMSERKYRQRGYMENDKSREQRPKQQQPARDREGPRSPGMMAFGEKVKCSACGVTIQGNIGLESTC
ncbi:MAG TPA: hypothetical protein VLN44_08255, partial [Pyrinomonadaceae bacterium]|nr:hypothetical protein [Pyrinomonadaceae bacterium]